MHAALENLDMALQLHVAELEDNGGLLSEVTAQATQLAPAVEDLSKEHE